MQLSGEYTFAGPRDAVWTLLQDPEVLAAAMPGAEQLDKVGDDRYEAQLQVRVGPVNGVFATTISLTDKVPPERYTMLIDSKGATGFASGTAQVVLVEQDAATTVMRYEATLQVGGRIASVGQRMLDTVSKSLTRQSLEAMNEALRARLAAQGSAEPAPAYVPPTQADFARGVARDVVAESVTSGKTVWIVAGAVVVVIVVALLVL